LRFLASTVRYLSLAASAALAVLMTALIAVISVQVVMRYFFDSPLQWSLEISRILFVWIVFLGSAVAVRRGQYTALEVLSRTFPQWWSERIVPGMVVLFALLLAALGTAYVRGTHGGSFTMTGLPDTVVFVAPAVSAVLMLLFGVEGLLGTRRGTGGGRGAHAAGDL
jgi:TRAP-type C4-dicarboxylate transport system permease small subunit